MRRTSLKRAVFSYGLEEHVENANSTRRKRKLNTLKFEFQHVNF